LLSPLSENSDAVVYSRLAIVVLSEPSAICSSCNTSNKEVRFTQLAQDEKTTEHRSLIR
jgi:hypothetical protein